MKNEIINYGFVSPKIETDHYIYGASPLLMPDILPSGDWRPYLPVYEAQADKYETYGCTVWGLQNQIEILLKFKEGIEYNFDERYIYNIVEITPPGTDPQLTYEATRKKGLTQGLLLGTDTYEEFCKPRPMTEELIKEGLKWKYYLNHEWLWTNNPTKEARLALLRTGLKKGPIAVSVTGWTQDSNGLYIDLNGTPNTHWCVCVALEGESPIVFDSYDQSIKKLHPDHHIEVAKLIYLTIREEENKKTFTFIQSMLDWIKSYLPFLQKQIEALPQNDVKEVYEEVKEAVKEPKYDWSTPEKARHSVRVICDEEGLSVADKNDLCATVGAESGWKPTAIGKPNSDGSKDYGIVQINDKYWIGTGKTFPSREYVLTHPEECVRWMCKNWAKNKNWWYGYTNGSYKKFL